MTSAQRFHGLLLPAQAAVPSSLRARGSLVQLRRGHETTPGCRPSRPRKQRLKHEPGSDRAANCSRLIGRRHHGERLLGRPPLGRLADRGTGLGIHELRLGTERGEQHVTVERQQVGEDPVDTCRVRLRFLRCS